MNKKNISFILVLIILISSFSLNPFAVENSGVEYSITVDGTTFLNTDTRSGNGWSYEDGVLSLDNYSGSAITSSGDLTVIAKNNVTITGTPSDKYNVSSCGLAVAGTLILDNFGSTTIVGADNGSSKGGEAIVASEAVINSARPGVLNLRGGSGSVAIKANILKLEANQTEIRGGSGSAAIYFSTEFTVNGVTNAVISAGSASSYAITYLNGATYSFDKEEQKVEFYNRGSKVIIVAKNNSIPGDCNSDGSIDTKDVVLIAQFIAKWVVELDEAAADCKKDGLINTKDAVLLAQFLAKWQVTLG